MDTVALDVLLFSVLENHIKHSSFIHEIISRKWVFHGEELEMYPNIIYFSHPEFFFRDLSLFQLILCTDYSDDELGDIFEIVEPNQNSFLDCMIKNFGCDMQLNKLLNGFKSQVLSSEDF